MGRVGKLQENEVVVNLFEVYSACANYPQKIGSFLFTTFYNEIPKNYTEENE
jgi:hypothetical protein